MMSRRLKPIFLIGSANDGGKAVAHRIAMLWNRDDLGMSMCYDASAVAARSLGVAVQPLGPT
jgi:hypothetical protein